MHPVALDDMLYQHYQHHFQYILRMKGSTQQSSAVRREHLRLISEETFDIFL